MSFFWRVTDDFFDELSTVCRFVEFLLNFCNFFCRNVEFLSFLFVEFLSNRNRIFVEFLSNCYRIDDFLSNCQNIYELLSIYGRSIDFFCQNFGEKLTSCRILVHLVVLVLRTVRFVLSSSPNPLPPLHSSHTSSF